MNTPIKLFDFLQSLHDHEVSVKVICYRSWSIIQGTLQYQPPNTRNQCSVSGKPGGSAYFNAEDVDSITIEGIEELPILNLKYPDR